MLDQILVNGVLRVGVRVWPSPEYAPPAFRGASNATTGGALTGFEIDLAHLLADNLGVELQLIEAYPPVINSGAWDGQYDIALASLSPRTDTTLLYSVPYSVVPIAVLSRADTPPLEDVSDLSGLRIAVLEDSPFQALLVDGVPGQASGVVPIPVDNVATAVDQLASDGPSTPFEALIGPLPMLELALIEGLPLQINPVSQQIEPLPLSIATVPIDGLSTDRLLQELNRILGRLEQRGQLAEIHLTWYDRDYSP